MNCYKMDKIFYNNLMKGAQEDGINRYVVGAVIQRDSSVLLLKRPKDDFMGGFMNFQVVELKMMSHLT